MLPNIKVTTPRTSRRVYRKVVVCWKVGARSYPDGICTAAAVQTIEEDHAERIIPVLMGEREGGRIGSAGVRSAGTIADRRIST